MDKLILTPVPFDDFMNSMRAIIKEELQAIPKQEGGYDTDPVSCIVLCKFLNITEPTLIRWRNKGKIPFMQIGGRYRYDKNAVAKALESGNKKGGRL